jgi:hypothetical protein
VKFVIKDAHLKLAGEFSSVEYAPYVTEGKGKLTMTFSKMSNYVKKT